MGKRYEGLSQEYKEFIKKQHMFFIASASNAGEVNLSPRGYDVFRVTGDNEAVFLDYVGSGNRTARDIEADGEVTVMFCSFEGKPRILRLFCKGELIDKSDEKMRMLYDEKDLEGMRRFVKLHIYCVEHSCGMSVPYMEYQGEREQNREFCVQQEREGKLRAYEVKNATPPDLSAFRATNL
ncbi:pyridoxamine 5'-phosphate oxidase family protein [Sulfurimonas sp. HSL-1716]|uniref:pyridoxamine 5'-phosphate oxidase family protein n=1 Tax=Hydrocurvibacter sulfurireducens TaxID=3131937 RepID=UPI0031F81073